MKPIITQDDIDFLKVFKGCGKNVKLTAQRLGISVTATNMRLTRLRKKRQLLFDGLSAIRHYEDVLKPKKQSTWQDKPQEGQA
jgi:hypothetical protein